MLQVKICGITLSSQGEAIAQLGATALGYICVPQSSRYVSAQQIAPIIAAVTEQQPTVEHFGVFANAPLAEILTVTRLAGLTTIQLHGDETPATCQLLRDALEHSQLPQVKLVKALRIRTTQDLNEDLNLAHSYEPSVDYLLLDAYHPKQLGGTGQTLDWQALKAFSSALPWFLAGGLTPNNVLSALEQLTPNGIDLSSGVERSPGDKDLEKVNRLFEILKTSNKPQTNLTNTLT